MKTAIFPGSFDPITLGHLDLICRASKMFDNLIIAVAVNSSKRAFFSIDQRLNFIQRSISEIGLQNVLSKECEGLVAKFAQENNACAIIRGVRTEADFGYELPIAAINRELFGGVDTILLPAEGKFSHISSSIVKELASYGGDISPYISSEILHDVINAFKNQ